MIRKWLVIGIILLAGLNIIPAVGSFSVMYSIQQVITMPLSGLRGDNFTINGTIGENGWYRSGVLITISFDPNYTAAVYYKIDNGDWTLYTGPFYINENGEHTLMYYYVDYEGTQSAIFGPYWFRIDSIPPTITLVVDAIGHNRYKIYAEVSDSTSGVNRVEFFLNDYLIYTDYEAPYEWFYKGPSFNYNSLVFDNAGNAAMPSQTPTDQISYFAIGFIHDPQFNEFGGTFFARFVIVIEKNFHAFLSHFSTLSYQQFGFNDCKGYISENFMIVRAKAY